MASNRKLSPFGPEFARDLDACLDGVALAFEQLGEEVFTGREVAYVIREIGQEVITRTDFEQIRKQIEGLEEKE